ncbi:hypothetical protein HaLaN_20766, partial [Haematococcus lacustris]
LLASSACFPWSQQPQSLVPALPRQPSAASVPRLSRQLSPPSPPRARARARARLPKPSQHHSQAGGARWSCATGQTRELFQPRARNTLAWATSGCETSLPSLQSAHVFMPTLKIALAVRCLLWFEDQHQTHISPRVSQAAVQLGNQPLKTVSWRMPIINHPHLHHRARQHRCRAAANKEVARSQQGMTWS